MNVPSGSTRSCTPRHVRSKFSQLAGRKSCSTCPTCRTILLCQTGAHLTSPEVLWCRPAQGVKQMPPKSAAVPSWVQQTMAQALHY